MLNTAAFQQKLADYSSRGIPVQVELVPEGTLPAPPAPAPAAPTPTPAPPPAPAPVMVTQATQVMRAARGAGELVVGGLGGLATAATAGVLAAGGAIMIDSVFAGGLGPAIQALSQHGVAGLFSSHVPVVAGLAAATGILGGFKVGSKLGAMAGRVAGLVVGAVMGINGYMLNFVFGGGQKMVPLPAPNPAPAPATPPAKKLSSLGFLVAQSAAGVGFMTGACGGAAAGVSLAATGSMFASSLGGQLATPGMLVAAGVGAAVVGVMGAVGGWEIGKSLDKLIS